MVALKRSPSTTTNQRTRVTRQETTHARTRTPSEASDNSETALAVAKNSPRSKLNLALAEAPVIEPPSEPQIDDSSFVAEVEREAQKRLLDLDQKPASTAEKKASINALESDSPLEYQALIQKYKYLSSLKDKNILKRLIIIAKQDSNSSTQAKEMVLGAHLALLIKKVRGSNFVQSTNDFKELLQNEVLEFLKILKTFDPEKGTKLSTYCTYSHLNAQKHYMDGKRNISVPAYCIDFIITVLKHAKKGIRIGGTSRKPILEPRQISTSKDFLSFLESMNKSKYKSEKDLYQSFMAKVRGADASAIKQMFDSARSYSYTGSTQNEDDRKFELADPSTTKPKDTSTTIEEIKKLMNKVRLSHREKTILILRYDLGGKGNGELTLEEVGQVVKVTKERVRQIEAKALKKLHEFLEAHPEFI